MEDRYKDKGVLYYIWVASGLTVLFIVLVRPLIIQENAYRKIEGEIVSSRLTSNDYIIILNTSDIIFRASRSHGDALQEKAVVGKEAVIWYSITRARRANPFRRYFIQKMVVDNEVVVPYFRGIGIGVFFSGATLFLLILTILHIVKLARKKELESGIALAGADLQSVPTSSKAEISEKTK